MKNIICKSCGKPDVARYKGYCQRCWLYFVYNHYKTFEKPEYGKIAFVEDECSPQYGMVICHICGKAYNKLQQHIYYSHHISKRDYCIQFGIDVGSQLTSQVYHDKMSKYAYEYNMPEQLKQAGKDTRFKTGHKNNYVRSAMTIERLKIIGSSTIHKNRGK